MPSKRYFGYKLNQRDNNDVVPYFIFYARVKDVIDWVGIRRSSEIPQGTQRVLRPARKRAITNFLASNATNTIPNNILLALGPEQTNFTPYISDDCLAEEEFFNKCQDALEWGFLEINFEEDLADHDKPALVVDGQHRLYGMSEFGAENIPLLFVCLINAPLEEQAFQFIVVNNKAVKVPTYSVKSIIADINEDSLHERLLNAGIKYGEKSPILRRINDDNENPYFQLLNWDYNRDGDNLVPITAIEQALKFTSSIFRTFEEDEDSLYDFFTYLWRGVRAAHNEIWGDNSSDNKLMKKVSISAINEFVVKNLKTLWQMGHLDFLDSVEVERQTFRLFEKIPDEFWISEWNIERISDNANVREMIISDIEIIIENYNLKKEWNKDSVLVPFEADDE